MDPIYYLFYLMKMSMKNSKKEISSFSIHKAFAGIDENFEKSFNDIIICFIFLWIQDEFL
jgi:hypothetical protein